MISDFLKKLDELNKHEPHKYSAQLRAAKTPYEKLSTIRDAAGATRGRELRDHDNASAHRLCDEIGRMQLAIDHALFVQVKAESDEQIKTWKDSILTLSLQALDRELEKNLENEADETGEDELSGLISSIIDNKGPSSLEMRDYYKELDKKNRVLLTGAIEDVFAKGDLSFHAIQGKLSSSEKKYFIEVGFSVLDHEASYLFSTTLLELTAGQFNDAQSKVTQKIEEFES